MRKKCFTLVELLVVIGIIAVLMGILLPALSAVKRTAQRVVCGSNLSGIGKGLLLYANEYGGEFPHAGDSTKEWGTEGDIANWADLTGKQYGNRNVTITSSLYLLIHFEDVTPAQFNCKGDAGVREFKLSDAKSLTGVDNMTQVWDFGGRNPQTGNYWPGQYDSYAYHNPYLNTDLTPTAQSFALRSDSNPSSPLCADRNPYWDKNAESFLNGTDCPPATGNPPSCDVSNNNTYKDDDKTGNSACHQRDGQNVLYVDTHVRFEKYPNVGIAKDNIWKRWSSSTNPLTISQCEVQVGQEPRCGGNTDAQYKAGWSSEDAFLVSETNKR